VELSACYQGWAKKHAKSWSAPGGLLQKRVFIDLDIRKPPYSTRYPELVNYLDTIGSDWEYEGMRPRRNVLRRNVIVGGNKNPVLLRYRYAQFDSVGNFQATENPGFVDRENANFTLREDSEVFERLPDFRPVPFGKMGLYVDAYRTALPVSAPVITPISRVFLDDIEVTLAPSPGDTARDDVVVRYTTDGSDPDDGDAVARGVLTFKDTTRVKARTFVTPSASVRPSPVVSVLFEKTDRLYLSFVSEVEASAHQGLKKNINYAGSGPVSLGGKRFGGSLMACPAQPARRAHVTYSLSGPLAGVKRFLAEVGIDDAMTSMGSVVFIVEVKRDGEWSQVFKSPTLRARGGSRPIDVDITGVEAIRLVTTDAGDNIHGDHAVWGGARVE